MAMHSSALPVYQLCQRASREIRRLYVAQLAQALPVVSKADGTPVTEADTRSHELLQAGLEKLMPGVPVVSEEASVPPWSSRQHWSQYWLVDPLDGTREFIAGSGHFSINLALVEDHRPVLGAIYLPMTGEMYWGGEGSSPVIYRGGQRRQVRPRVASLQQVLKVIHSRGGREQAPMRELKANLRLRWPQLVEEVRGSAWKFCRLAEGGAHIYPRFGETSEWDTAAGQALLEAAGGRVLDEKGEPLRYNLRPELQNPSFFALAPADFDWCEVLGIT
jgi:3'(2'), 5'-bisphosphate nucleotidase